MTHRSTAAALGALALAALPAFAATEKATCADCHGDVAARMSADVHLRLKPFETQGRIAGCEGCHGDGARHMETGDPKLIRGFKDGTGGEACLECHGTRGQSQWRASTHAQHDVSCASCHKPHQGARPTDACRSCHGRELAQFQLPSHHPVREGKLSCASCHDVHSANESALKVGQRGNELCYRCHLDKEGPYVFEHQPVQEDCRQCHTPHGSVANKLLTATEPMLCLQCHEFHFHGGYVAANGEIEIGGIKRESPFGALGMNRAFGTKCSQCHVQVHGSDLPGQGVSSRGRGLVR